MNRLPLFILSLIFTAVPIFSFSQPLPSLIPYYDGQYWGYCDSNRHVVIKPEWDSAGFFAGGRAIVVAGKFNNKAFCIINEKGKYIVPPLRRWNGTWKGRKGAELNAIDNVTFRWGMIDTNNNELVHFEYDHPNMGKYCMGFQYDSMARKWYLIESKNGKEGVIDDQNKVLVSFKYEHVFFPVSHQFGFGNIDLSGAPFYFYVNGAAGTGIIDTNDEPVIKPEYYDVNYWPFCKSLKSSFNGFMIRVTNSGPVGWVSAEPGKLTIPPVYRQLGLGSGKYILFMKDVPFDAAHPPLYGIMDSNGKVLLEPGYEQIYFINDSIKVAKTGRDAGHTLYYKYLDKTTFKPLSGWHEDVEEEKAIKEADKDFGFPSNEGWCGTGRREAQEIQAKAEGEERAHAATQAHMVKRCKRGYREQTENVYDFVKDSLHYNITRVPAGQDKYYCVESDRNIKTNAPAKYYAVVDTGYNYLYAPQREYAVEYIDRAGQYAIITRDGEYSFLDSLRRQVFPYQQLPIVAPFLLNNEWYAFGTRDTTDKEDREELKLWQPSGDGIYSSARGLRKVRIDPALLHKTLLYNGQAVKALEGYDIVSKVEKNALTGEEGDFFVAKNKTGATGVVSLQGAVLYPKVSFVYHDLVPVGGGFFMAASASQRYSLVDRRNKNLFPGLGIVSVVRPMLNGRLLDEEHTYLSGSLFKVAYRADEQQGYFYMDNNGVRFARNIE